MGTGKFYSFDSEVCIGTESIRTPGEMYLWTVLGRSRCRCDMVGWDPQEARTGGWRAPEKQWERSILDRPLHFCIH